LFNLYLYDMVEKTVFKNKKQNSNKKDTDIPSLISQRESKKELLNHSFTSARLKDVNIYNDGKFSHLYSRYKHYDTNKYITVDIETNNNDYESTFIITPHDVVYDSSQFEDIFKKLQNKKGKTIFVGKMFNKQIISLDKPFKNSISYQYITTFIKKSSRYNFSNLNSSSKFNFNIFCFSASEFICA